MRLALVIGALALAMPASDAALAQRKRPRVPENCYSFACPPRPIPPAVPSEEAMELARKLVRALDVDSVVKRNGELVRMAEAYEPPRKPEPVYPDGPIRAVPPVDLANRPMWGIVTQQRVIDHAALVYARKYPVEQLKQMVEFVQSPAGKALLKDRLAASEEIEREIGSRLLEEDLWNVVCGVPVWTDIQDAPHHEFERLHPPMDFPLPPRPRWCAQLQAR